MSGTRYNTGKVLASAVDPEFILGVAEVLTFGAQKYERNNWRKGLPHDEICDSLLRHTYSYLRGELLDSESGLDHRFHMACNIMFLTALYPTKGDVKLEEKNDSPDRRRRDSLPVRAYRTGRDLLGRLWRKLTPRSRRDNPSKS